MVPKHPSCCSWRDTTPEFISRTGANQHTVRSYLHSISCLNTILPMIIGLQLETNRGGISCCCMIDYRLLAKQSHHANSTWHAALAACVLMHNFLSIHGIFPWCLQASCFCCLSLPALYSSPLVQCILVCAFGTCCHFNSRTFILVVNRWSPANSFCKSILRRRLRTKLDLTDWMIY